MKLVSTGIIGLTLLSAIGSAVFSGFPTALLVLAGGALCLVISLTWASLEKLGGTGELTLEEAMALAAPTAAEEQKRAVLRTLKDLEYELSVGKITPEDFAAASEHFRGEAKRLIAEADSSLSTQLELAEARAQKYLNRATDAAENEPAKRKPKAKQK